MPKQMANMALIFIMPSLFYVWLFLTHVACVQKVRGIHVIQYLQMRLYISFNPFIFNPPFWIDIFVVLPK